MTTRRMVRLYDSLVRTEKILDPKYLERRTHLFGNTNVGRTADSNMPIPSSLASDRTFFVTAVRTVLKMPTEALLEAVKDVLMWRLFVADLPQIGGFVDDLVVPFSTPIMIPARQCFSVEMEFMEGTDMGSIRERICLTPGRKIIRFELHGEEIRDIG